MSLIRKNPDILIALIVAAAALGCAPFSLDYYLNCINLPLLMKLFCLMAVVAGLREYGLLDRFWKTLMPKRPSERSIGQFFIFICFFSSMFITNDVALIIFVPLCISVLRKSGLERHIIYVVVLETVAANMGSMVTPMGNPQNLFIFEHYHLHIKEFLGITAPVTICCALCLYAATLRLDKKHITLPEITLCHLSKRVLLLLSFLFTICILCVLRIISTEIMVLTVVFFLNFLKGRLLLKVDFKLLVLFMLLFVAVGGLVRIPQFQSFSQEIVNRSVYLSTLITCQVISNVPAAVMISGFTDDYRNLLLGVSIGGLGTMIASMASLISFKAYMQMPGHRTFEYVAVFTLCNVLLLVVLSLVKDYLRF